MEPIWTYNSNSGNFSSKVNIFENNKDGRMLYNIFISYKCKYFEETTMQAGFTDLLNAALSAGYQLRKYEEREEDADAGYKCVKVEDQKEKEDNESDLKKTILDLFLDIEKYEKDRYNNIMKIKQYKEDMSNLADGDTELANAYKEIIDSLEATNAALYGIIKNKRDEFNSYDQSTVSIYDYLTALKDSISM
jgi:hypothetical protein